MSSGLFGDRRNRRVPIQRGVYVRYLLGIGVARYETLLNKHKNFAINTRFAFGLPGQSRRGGDARLWPDVAFYRREKVEDCFCPGPETCSLFAVKTIRESFLPTNFPHETVRSNNVFVTEACKTGPAALFHPVFD